MMPDLSALAGMSDEELEQTLIALTEHRKFNLLDFIELYPRQKEFMAMGAHKQERLFFAGNQMGKTFCGAAECAYHLTGLYPDWWEGKRFDHPVRAWAGGVSTTACREQGQRLLCGPPGIETGFGTGLIPRHLFADKPTLARGAVADAYDTIAVWHHINGVRDGISTLQFKSYEQGREKFQGSTLDFIWWDEEPKMEIYVEGNARYTATGGMSYLTFTPLHGMSTVVVRFLHERDDRRDYLTMGYKDALHMTPEKLADAMAKYPAHEHDARMNGAPLLGSGRIFIDNEATFVYPASQVIPDHWPKLWGVDFGIEHPFAAVLIAWDRDLDIIYVMHTYRAAGALPLVHSEALRAVCPEAPVAWPHDGNTRVENKLGELAPLYKKFDLRMLPKHAHYSTGGFSTEAVIKELQQRFQCSGGPGGIRVREDLGDFFEEYRMYHRKEGLIVKERDDILSALMKAVMMRRHARIVTMGYAPRPPRVRPSRPVGGRINPWTGRTEY
jgi:phage terminase large subunit-like protein